jgi:Icc-related predicted phosphoesterase
MRIAFLILLFSAVGVRADWSFVMLGDTRGERETTTTGVSTYLNTIALKIASLNPDLVLVSGDLVNGNDVPDTSILTNYTLQFNNWKTAMQPVFNYATSTGIPIYPVRGNHENCDHEGPTVHHLKEAYYNAFIDYVPLNGPNNGGSDNQVGYSYSFTYNNANFVVADQYFYYTASGSVTGYHELARSWVVQQFAATNMPFNIFMAHEPFFNAEHTTPGGFLGTSTNALQTRAEFWNELGTNGVQLYLTGHIHNEIVASTTNEYGTIIQLIAGNGGAALGAVGGSSEPGVELLFTNDTHYGFSLATVSDTSMTIEYYLLDPADDTWSKASYTTTIAAVPEPSSLLLLAAGLLGVFPCAVRRRFR